MYFPRTDADDRQSQLKGHIFLSSFTSGEAAVLLTSDRYHHVTVHRPDRRVCTDRALDPDRGAAQRYDAGRAADRGARRQRRQPAVPQGQAVAPQNNTGAATAETKGETVEHRITVLHVALKITPAQEKQWNAVAQAMRENAATMDKLVASKRTTPPQSMTAVDDLKTYQQFAQAHVDGLKNLIASFDTLYDAMPTAQQKIADRIFNTAGREPAPSHASQGSRSRRAIVTPRQVNRRSR